MHLRVVATLKAQNIVVVSNAHVAFKVIDIVLMAQQSPDGCCTILNSGELSRFNKTYDPEPARLLDIFEASSRITTQLIQ